MTTKIALVTGASRGIGAAIAEAFASSGYHLALCCRTRGEQLDAHADRLRRKYGVQIRCFVGDVGTYGFVRAMVDATLETFGHIDVLINNAGISFIGLLTDMSPGDWEQVTATNLTSVFLTSRLCTPSMVARKSGRIINVSSVWGSVGASCETAYSACKGGVDAFTRALGKELAPSGIPVNAIACGAIDTDMNRCFSAEELDALAQEIPAGRMGTPEEVAELTLLLCSAPAYLTGQVITLDGGWT